MITEQRLPVGDGLQPLGLLADKDSRVLQTLASPSIAQLVMRVALAIPFWRSGILKWTGFGRLSDTAVTLFTDEFMLHLPGGPYHFPAPAVTAFPDSGTPGFTRPLRTSPSPMARTRCWAIRRQGMVRVTRGKASINLN